MGLFLFLLFLGGFSIFPVFNAQDWRCLDVYILPWWDIFYSLPGILRSSLLPEGEAYPCGYCYVEQVLLGRRISGTGHSTNSLNMNFL